MQLAQETKTHRVIFTFSYIHYFILQSPNDLPLWCKRSEQFSIEPFQSNEEDNAVFIFPTVRYLQKQADFIECSRLPRLTRIRRLAGIKKRKSTVKVKRALFCIAGANVQKCSSCESLRKSTLHFCIKYEILSRDQDLLVTSQMVARLIISHFLCL